MLSLFNSRIPSTFIGYDNLLRDFEHLMSTREVKWPVYNIRKVDDRVTIIEMAVAGFSKKDVQVKFDDDSRVLTVEANKTEKNKGNLVWNLMAERNVLKSFTINKDIQEPQVQLKDGLLTITLVKQDDPPKPATVRLLPITYDE